MLVITFSSRRYIVAFDGTELGLALESVRNIQAGIRQCQDGWTRFDVSPNKFTVGYSGWISLRRFVAGESSSPAEQFSVAIIRQEAWQKNWGRKTRENAAFNFQSPFSVGLWLIKKIDGEESEKTPFNFSALNFPPVDGARGGQARLNRELLAATNR